jgi:hypothetical protein
MVYWCGLVWVAYEELPRFAFSLITNRMKNGATNAPNLSADVKNDKPKEISQDAKSRNVQTGRGHSAGTKIFNKKKNTDVSKRFHTFCHVPFLW